MFLRYIKPQVPSQALLLFVGRACIGPGSLASSDDSVGACRDSGVISMPSGTDPLKQSRVTVLITQQPPT